MSRWIKKTAVAPLNDPIRVVHGSSAEADHECFPPSGEEAGYRSIWECDCGRRWRLAAPYWRELSTPRETSSRSLAVPAWVQDMGRATG